MNTASRAGTKYLNRSRGEVATTMNERSSKAKDLVSDITRDLPLAYSINRGGGLKLDIALIETEKLLLHEGTIPEILETLIHQLEKEGILRAPVIVDPETLVVLDGIHRVTALRMLGCRFTCACLVDYQSPEIKVDRWFRTISESFDAQKAAKVAGELGLELVHLKPCVGLMDEGGSVLRFEEASYKVVAPALGLLSAFDAMRKFELRLRAMGFEVGYETERDAEEKLVRGAMAAVLCPHKIGKGQVIDIAKLGRVFPSKATRHIIPGRPVGVDVPLSLLQGLCLSVEEANERLSALLSIKRIKHLPPGTVWRERRYDEDLYVFKDT